MIGSIHEECGVFGIWEPKTTDVAKTAYLALYALQHRGQQSCGIAVNDDGVFTHYRDIGLVPEIFTQERLEKLGKGNIAIGHVQYSKKSLINRANAQPLHIRHIKGNMALAHNGSLTNAAELRQKYELKGAIFHGTSDTEVIAYSITNARLTTPSIEKAVEKAMYELKGAYSCVLMSATKLIGMRDPVGIRPLCIGKTSDGAYVLASESCALDIINAKLVRDVRPGEIVVINDGKLTSITTHCKGSGKICIFEYIYFARSDSDIEGVSVHKARQKAGELLAKQHPVDADIVIGVPNSGLDAALGYSKASGIPYGFGFIKNSYIGRSFIQPSQCQRSDAVKIKINVIKSTVSGKRVVMIDDSIVRGTTCARIVNLLREAGAKEVHMRVSSPPFIYPCYFGTDIDSKDKLIACRLDSVDSIAKEIGVDSLGYLNVDSLYKIMEGANCGFCDGCFSGNYPIEIPKNQAVNRFETKIHENESHERT
ncbi:MAG TPA: amidophosphoribosyltransferase [Clostridiales bacterium]|nr:amidophosphoribosyltransferase [Clostridiales bacterium]